MTTIYLNITFCRQNRKTIQSFLQNGQSKFRFCIIDCLEKLLSASQLAIGDVM